MAEKPSQLLLDALTRAVTEPTGLALYANKSTPGLFPATATAKVAADRAKSDGLLRVIQNEPAGRSVREVCVLTDKGMQYLIEQSSPRRLLEDFVRVLEERQSAAQALTEAVAQMTAVLTALRSAVEQVLPRMSDVRAGAGKAGECSENPPSGESTDAGLPARVRTLLVEWHATAGTAHDCPLPDLYRRLQPGPGLSIGQFHDVLRQMHAAHQVYLHPWTGPLYALPEPGFALLVGHEVAYYASIR